jgi:hypothetical protein
MAYDELTLVSFLLLLLPLPPLPLRVSRCGESSRSKLHKLCPSHHPCP